MVSPFPIPCPGPVLSSRGLLPEAPRAVELWPREGRSGCFRGLDSSEPPGEVCASVL